MTLIVGIKAKDGIVFASDAQVTRGDVRFPGQKIRQLGPRSLWAAAGELALIQRVAERIEGLPGKAQPLQAIRDQLAIFVKESVHALLMADFRTEFCAGNPERLLALHQADFLFVEQQPKSQGKILHVTLNGTTEWVETPFAVTGSGASFAYALLRKHADDELSVAGAKVLGYKVIEEAIEVGSYGLGYPIRVWSIGLESDCCLLDGNELKAVIDTAVGLRQQERERFMALEQRTATTAPASMPPSPPAHSSTGVVATPATGVGKPATPN